MLKINNDIIALKKIILNNENIQKLIMHYRVIIKQNNTEEFYQDKSEYDNKYESNDTINIKEKYLDKTLSNAHIQNNLQNSISNTLSSYNSLIDEALHDILDYLMQNHIEESNIDAVINNYVDHMYISLDARIPIENNMHSIDENLLFSNNDKNMIDAKLSPQYIKEEYLNNENN